MGAQLSAFFAPPSPPKPELPLPLLLFHAQYIGQPLSRVVGALRNRGIEAILVPLKERETWSAPPRKATGRVFVLYSADSLLVHDVTYE